MRITSAQVSRRCGSRALTNQSQAPHTQTTSVSSPSFHALGSSCHTAYSSSRLATYIRPCRTKQGDLFLGCPGPVRVALPQVGQRHVPDFRVGGGGCHASIPFSFPSGSDGVPWPVPYSCCKQQAWGGGACPPHLAPSTEPDRSMHSVVSATASRGALPFSSACVPSCAS